MMPTQLHMWKYMV